ncbi:MAG TPA: PqqD family protein [Methanosarcinales archaeon]|nr:PqqD family protein [Methanosarcinales archaeon]
MVSLHSYPARSDDLVWRMVDGEVVILTTDGNEVHTLNRVGSEIWDLSDGTKNLEEIASLICERFEVSSEESCADALEFAEELSLKNILQVTKGSSDD